MLRPAGEGAGSAPGSATRARLAAMPFEARLEEITAWMRRKAAAITGIDPERVNIDRRQADPGSAFLALAKPVQEEIGLRLYEVDIPQLWTLRMAAEHVAREIAVPALPTAPLSDLYDKGAWAWGPLTREFGPPLQRPMVFILSGGRTGSTLLRAMLAGHPALFVPPELSLLPFSSLGRRCEQAQTLGYDWLRIGLVSALQILEGLPAARTVAALETLERADTPMPEMFERLQAAAAPRILIDKSPFNGFHPEWLRYAERVFAGARYIHLVRHPVPVIESWVRMRFYRMFRRHFLVWDENPWLYAEKSWASVNRHITDFLDTIEPERRLRVKFEDLVSDPAAAGNDICRFLGVPFDPVILTPHDDDRMTLDPSGRLPAVGDPNFRLRSAIDPALASTRRADSLGWSLSEPTRAIAARLQYKL